MHGQPARASTFSLRGATLRGPGATAGAREDCQAGESHREGPGIREGAESERDATLLSSLISQASNLQLCMNITCRTLVENIRTSEH
ncbi:hypothetical protein E2C01_007542 [Portunus trituberculatus]|uniref:Uncharacterized protein n=1 Tax=Portunus trituberculatus TaxID=210409 RepID=A0A5B7CY66_PORTR|nr:hypothetical protein [Portunus trituberculatus]